MPRETESQPIQEISLKELQQIDRIGGRLNLKGVSLFLIGVGGQFTASGVSITVDNENTADIIGSSAAGFGILMFYGLYLMDKAESAKIAVVREARRRGLQVQNKLMLVAFGSIKHTQDINLPAA